MTAVRRQKDIANTAKAAGDDVLRREAQYNIERYQAAYDRITDKAMLTPDRGRMRVSGFKDVKPHEALQRAADYGILQVDENQPAFRSLTDVGARQWYLEHDRRIPDLIDRSKPLEEQARQACEMRNICRTLAREFMKDQESRKTLDERYPNKSFEELIQDKMLRKGLSRQQAIRDILETSTKTNKDVNRKLGLEGN